MLFSPGLENHPQLFFCSEERQLSTLCIGVNYMLKPYECFVHTWCAFITAKKLRNVSENGTGCRCFNDTQHLTIISLNRTRNSPKKYLDRFENLTTQ